MKLTKQSPLTGQYNTMDLPITQADLDRWHKGRELIQNVFPNLSKEQREFIMTGYTPEDWKRMFPDNCGNCYHWDCNTTKCRNEASQNFRLVMDETSKCDKWVAE